MRLTVALLLLVMGCASGDRRPPSKDHFYRPLTTLPRHEALVHRPKQQQQQPQHVTNYNTTNTYNYWRQPLAYPVERVCRHIRVPINERRWQAPVYKPYFRGYDQCGLPIYVQKLISPGGGYTITVGYKCRRCGYRL